MLNGWGMPKELPHAGCRRAPAIGVAAIACLNRPMARGVHPVPRGRQAQRATVGGEMLALLIG